MSRTIINSKANGRKAFTMVETILTTLVASFVMMAVWGVYMMASQWWAETMPRLDLEKAARMALLSVIEGSVDDNAGTYTIDAVGSTRTRRNGIAWANAYPDIYDNSGNKIASDCEPPSDSACSGPRIAYKLVPDVSNARQFYYGTYNGNGYVFYRNGAGTVNRLESTKGISSIQFSRLPDASGNPYPNIIQVSVTAEKDIYGTRKASPYHVKIMYNDTVYLRNAL